MKLALILAAVLLSGCSSFRLGTVSSDVDAYLLAYGHVQP